MKPYRFSTEEIKVLLNKMVILVDSREKKNEHILEYFRRKGFLYQITKLDFGDYSFMIPASATGVSDFYFHDSIVIERKNSLEELSGNLTRERTRFEVEFMKARNRGVKIYLMVEAPGGYNDIIEHNYQTRFDPISYIGSLRTWENRFDCHVQFMKQQHSGYYIASSFFYYAREKLK